MRIAFDDRVVLVTGAAQDIGRAIATAFADLGARVHAIDVDEAGLARIGTGTDRIAPHALDISDPRAVQALVPALWAEILVNCAGGVRGQVGRPLEVVTATEWHSVLDANLTGTFQMAQAVTPAMKARGVGRIVNISSGAGRGISGAGIQAYAAAKAGQIGVTRQLAQELGPHGITVNCVAPGFVRSNPTSDRQWEAMGEDGQQALLKNIAMRRLGTPGDIANAVLFLASDQAGWITGETLGADGGK